MFILNKLVVEMFITDDYPMGGEKSLCQRLATVVKRLVGPDTDGSDAKWSAE